jgi:hypothetical protein
MDQNLLCGSQIYTKSSSFGTQQENGNVWISAEIINEVLARVDFATSIQSRVSEAHFSKDIFKYIQHHCKLTKYEHSVTLSKQF